MTSDSQSNANESDNRIRFKTFAERRTDKAIKAINSIGHLHNNDYYEWTDKDVNKIFNAINAAIKESRSKFDSTNSKQKSGFKL